MARTEDAEVREIDHGSSIRPGVGVECEQGFEEPLRASRFGVMRVKRGAGAADRVRVPEVRDGHEPRVRPVATASGAYAAKDNIRPRNRPVVS